MLSIDQLATLLSAARTRVIRAEQELTAASAAADQAEAALCDAQDADARDGVW